MRRWSQRERERRREKMAGRKHRAPNWWADCLRFARIHHGRKAFQELQARSQVPGAWSEESWAGTSNGSGTFLGSPTWPGSPPPCSGLCNSVFSLILSALQKRGQAKLPQRTLCSHSPSFARFFFDFHNLPTLHPSPSSLHCPNCPPPPPQSWALQPSSWLCGGQDSSHHGSLLAPVTLLLPHSTHTCPVLSNCSVLWTHMMNT